MANSDKTFYTSTNCLQKKYQEAVKEIRMEESDQFSILKKPLCYGTYVTDSVVTEGTDGFLT